MTAPAGIPSPLPASPSLSFFDFDHHFTDKRTQRAKSLRHSLTRAAGKTTSSYLFFVPPAVVSIIPWKFNELAPNHYLTVFRLLFPNLFRQTFPDAVIVIQRNDGSSIQVYSPICFYFPKYHPAINTGLIFMLFSKLIEKPGWDHDWKEDRWDQNSGHFDKLAIPSSQHIQHNIQNCPRLKACCWCVSSFPIQFRPVDFPERR